MNLKGYYKKYPELMSYVQKDVTRTNQILGVGSFGSVEELVIAGKQRVAGKIFHMALLDPLAAGFDRILNRFLLECQMLSKLNHPNIVQFIGMCFLKEYSHPILLMELMYVSLDMHIERNYQQFPLGTKLSIFYDVSKGLSYLHGQNPPIIHRDLTCRNVLLNKDASVAKIADLGNAHVVDLEKASRVLSRTPGTLVYMPPEAIACNPIYGSPIDIFSFGHLALYTMIETFPGDLLPVKNYDEEGIHVTACSEVERRKVYIEMLDKNFGQFNAQIVDEIKRCLHDLPQKRPSADEIMHFMHVLLEKHQGGDQEVSYEVAGSTTYIENEDVNKLVMGMPEVLEICVTSGAIKKKKEWKRYAFSIENSNLTYRKSNKDIVTAPISTISSIMIMPCSDFADQKSYFTIKFTGKQSPWNLRAWTDQKRKNWISALNRCILIERSKVYEAVQKSPLKKMFSKFSRVSMLSSQTQDMAETMTSYDLPVQHQVLEDSSQMYSGQTESPYDYIPDDNSSDSSEYEYPFESRNPNDLLPSLPSSSSEITNYHRPLPSLPFSQSHYLSPSSLPIAREVDSTSVAPQNDESWEALSGAGDIPTAIASNDAYGCSPLIPSSPLSSRTDHISNTQDDADPQSSTESYSPLIPSSPLSSRPDGISIAQDDVDPQSSLLSTDSYSPLTLSPPCIQIQDDKDDTYAHNSVTSSSTYDIPQDLREDKLLLPSTGDLSACESPDEYDDITNTGSTHENKSKNFNVVSQSALLEKSETVIPEVLQPSPSYSPDYCSDDEYEYHGFSPVMDTLNTPFFSPDLSSLEPTVSPQKCAHLKRTISEKKDSSSSISCSSQREHSQKEKCANMAQKQSLISGDDLPPTEGVYSFKTPVLSRSSSPNIPQNVLSKSKHVSLKQQATYQPPMNLKAFSSSVTENYSIPLELPSSDITESLKISPDSPKDYIEFQTHILNMMQQTLKTMQMTYAHNAPGTTEAVQHQSVIQERHSPSHEVMSPDFSGKREKLQRTRAIKDPASHTHILMDRCLKELKKKTPLIDPKNLLITDKDDIHSNPIPPELRRLAKANSQSLTTDHPEGLLESLDHMRKQALFIPMSKLSNIELIAGGHFGTQYTAELSQKPSGQRIKVVMKAIRKPLSQRGKENFIKDQAITADMIHPNIVRFFGVVDQELPWIVIEQLANGDLKKFLQNNERPVEMLLHYMLDTSLGLHYISEKGLVHRDVAARNIMVSNNERCKVGNFGLLKKLRQEQDHKRVYVTHSDTPMAVRWMAPENLDVEKKLFSTASDVWSFGVLQWEIRHPFDTPYSNMTNEEVKQRVISGKARLQVPTDYPAIVQQIMRACWQDEPSERPSFLLISELLTNLTISDDY